MKALRSLIDMRICFPRSRKRWQANWTILTKERDIDVSKERRQTQPFSQHYGGLPSITEEQEELNRAVALSGLPKQEYCYRKCMGREVVVQPNPRVHKALKTQMAAILAELERIAAGDSVPDELLSTIDLIAITMQGLKGEDAND